MDAVMGMFCRGLLILTWTRNVYGERHLESTYSSYRRLNDLQKRFVHSEPVSSQCLGYYDFRKGNVVQVSKSEKLGGQMINATTGLSPLECLKQCCATEHCTTAAYERLGKQNCYLFACGDADDFRCEFVPYSDYEVAILTVPRRELLHRSSDVKKSNMADGLKNLDLSPVSEEIASSRHCSRYEFQCKTSGQCIAAYDRCNNVFECPDRSDEEDCDRFQQDKYQSEDQLKSHRQNPSSDRLEDDLRQRQSDDDTEQQTLWDRGRNRLPLATATTPEFWKFQPQSSPRSLATQTLPPTVPLREFSTSATAPISSSSARAVFTTSSSSSTETTTEQELSTKKLNETSVYYPSWLDFSDPSHFLISVLLILAIGFCTGTTVFVICSCLCKKRPKVTKYRVVDPDAEDFLLSGTYG